MIYPRFLFVKICLPYKIRHYTFFLLEQAETLFAKRDFVHCCIGVTLFFRGALRNTFIYIKTSLKLLKLCDNRLIGGLFAIIYNVTHQ